MIIDIDGDNVSKLIYPILKSQYFHFSSTALIPGGLFSFSLS